MKKFIIAALLLACSCSITKKEDLRSKQRSIETENSKFFVSTPIVQFNNFACPCVNVEIEGKTYLLKLDLGFQGDMAIQEEAVNSMSSKAFVREYSSYGIRGKEYKSKLYQIPKLKIGSMTFSPPILHEENREYLKDSEFKQNEEDASTRTEEGRLGHTLFYNTNLLIDIPNSLIAFCDSLKTLQKHGYLVENSICTPLFLERGLVEFFAETSEGKLRCMLDTGATWNFLNSHLEEKQSIDQVMWDATNILKYPSFTIGGRDVGPIAFHRIPIKIPIRIEAILGMEFFETNLVFFDFSGGMAYFFKKSLDDH